MCTGAKPGNGSKGRCPSIISGYFGRPWLVTGIRAFNAAVYKLIFNSFSELSFLSLALFIFIYNSSFQSDLSIDPNSTQPSGQISLRSSFMLLQLFPASRFHNQGLLPCPQISPTDSVWISPVRSKKISIVIKLRLTSNQPVASKDCTLKYFEQSAFEKD